MEPDLELKQRMEYILVYHNRSGPSSCAHCGDLPLGRSFARHQVDLLLALPELTPHP